jgi:adenosylcobinamide-phosphate synthase
MTAEMTAATALAAVLMDAVLGEPRRWHPLVGFGRFANALEARLRAPAAGAEPQRWRGLVAVALAVLPCTVVMTALDRIPRIEFFVDAIALYLAIGHRSLREHAIDVYAALLHDELPLARSKLARMVSRDTQDINVSRIAAATVESVLENGNDAVFGALFWFAIGGAPGVVAYRLVNTLDAMWGYRSERYLHFGWAAARLDDALNFIPARLTALSYALLGHTACALRCWRLQAPAWDSPNAGPVMASGAGALKLSLGGGACYHGEWTERSALGEGEPADAGAIPRALHLVLRTLLLWLSVYTVARVLIHA